MKLVFAGTPEFASTALEHIVQAGFDVPLVLTQPDRPAGRGMKLQESAVKQTAQAHGIPVLQPRSLRLDGRFAEDAQAAQAALQAVRPDVMVVAAYGLILPQWVLDLPRHGCLNIHASLLPRWRGAAPIHRAIEAGDSATGITIMQMDAGLDTGAMCLTERLEIAPDATTASLHDALAAMGARLIVHALGQPLPLLSQPQPEAGVSYAHKIAKEEAWLDWQAPAQVLERKLRAFTPFPGGATRWGQETLKIWQAQVCPGAPGAQPGTVLATQPEGVVVACGQDALRLTQLQRAGCKRLPAAEFLRGCPLPIGSVLSSTPA